MTLKVGGSVSSKFGCLRQHIEHTDSGTRFNMGTVPGGSFITRVYAMVTTGFNSSGTDLITMGPEAGGFNDITTSLNVISAGLKAVDLQSVTVLIIDTPTDIYCQYNASVADTTTGECDVIVEYVTP